MRVLRLARLCAVAAIATVLLVVGTPALASADPGGGGTYCSGWAQAYNFRYRACTGFRTDRVDHSLEVQYLGSGGASIAYIDSDYLIGSGSWSGCTYREWESFNSGQYKSFYCSTARVGGLSYQTRGRLGYAGGWVYSPAATG